jgi:hypothetical protein
MAQQHTENRQRLLINSNCFADYAAGPHAQGIQGVIPDAHVAHAQLLQQLSQRICKAIHHPPT